MKKVKTKLRDIVLEVEDVLSLIITHTEIIYVLYLNFSRLGLLSVFIVHIHEVGTSLCYCLG